MLSRSPDHRVELSTGWHWLSAGTFQANVSILVDPLSVVMLLVVTGVGFLMHAYSVGYMDGDREERRFFAYLNLFVFSMLLLVLAGNFLILLAGWGLVGLLRPASVERPAAAAAAKKAFITNAIGDIGIALALFVNPGPRYLLDYPSVGGQAGGAGFRSYTANWIALLLLARAPSRSRPSSHWSTRPPHAMEAPTPVSALIHAATMVTAGAAWSRGCGRSTRRLRTCPISSPRSGPPPSLMAGLIAFVQTDIKRVIAYSTMSQIGYMFCAVGIGAYSAGIYHLVTLFFKALLLRRRDPRARRRAPILCMGGMAKFMPYMSRPRGVGGLALAGIPPFAGFFSKDQILADAMHVGGTNAPSGRSG